MMRKLTITTGLIFAACLMSCGKNSNIKQLNEADSDSISVEQNIADTIPAGARRLMDVYPNQGITYNQNKIWFPDSTFIVYDDGKEKDFVTKLDDCDIEDMFSMKYVRGSNPPDYLSDCGRGRSEQLYKKMYGSNEAAVRHNLVKVDWFGQKIPFTSVNGANKHLEDVAKELSKKPELRKYLVKASSFYWRKVRGANRQSAHSYGIAIDINTDYSNYWLWSNPKCSETDTLKYENRIPIEIVEVFEKHGFIWGGHWYHYDTMHFEYRPELLED